MFSLSAVYENSVGKRHRWTMKGVDPNKSAEEIRTTLEKLTIVNKFDRNGVNLFQKVITAKFVETIETPVFDTRDEAAIEADEVLEPEEEVELADLKEMANFFGFDEQEAESLSHEELQKQINEQMPPNFVFEGFVTEDDEDLPSKEEIKVIPPTSGKRKKKLTKKEKRLLKQFKNRR